MNRSLNQLLRGSALAVVVAAGILSILATGNSGGGDGTGPTSFHMTVKRLVSGGNMLCPTTNVQWVLEPVTLTGSTGISVGKQATGAYAGQSVPTGGPFECNFSDQTSFVDIRPGDWKLTATTTVGGSVSVSCTKTARQGSPASSFWTFDTAGKVLSCS